MIPVHCDCNWPAGSDYPQGDQIYWNYEINEFLNCNTPGPATCEGHTGTTASNQMAVNNSADYWLNNANNLYLSGFYEQAVLSYEKALKLNSSLPYGWLNMGNSLYFLGRYQESLNAYNAALNLEPKNADALEGKSKALKKLEENNISTAKQHL